MTQTFAILLDAYRELNYRRLFWIALALSGLVVVAVALIGINDRGFTVLTWTIETQWLNTGIITPATFYKSAFASLGVDIWLAWVATILALITTAGMIPDLVSSGSVDLQVSKPISRARLFLTKFAGGLLFSTLQVSIFTVASFFVIGLRGGAWEPGVFLAIPLVILFYSYLYSFCALVGVLTRSTVASLLFTILFWAVCALLWIAYVGVNSGRIANEIEIAAIERRIEKGGGDGSGRSGESRNEMELERMKSWQPFWERLSRYGEWVVTPIPKTAATIELLQRQLISVADLPQGRESSNNSTPFGGGARQQEMARSIEAWQRTYSPAWVIGTSLAFEVVVLALAAWIFSRRDY